MSARISHAACTHPSTKVARAACRRQRAKAVATIVSPIITAWESMKSGPLELTAAPARVSFDVTRENWRDVKGMTASITIAGETVQGQITGWSPRLFQFKSADNGKTVRIPADEIQKVIA